MLLRMFHIIEPSAQLWSQNFWLHSDLQRIHSIFVELLCARSALCLRHGCIVLHSTLLHWGIGSIVKAKQVCHWIFLAKSSGNHLSTQNASEYVNFEISSPWSGGIKLRNSSCLSVSLLFSQTQKHCDAHCVWLLHAARRAHLVMYHTPHVQLYISSPQTAAINLICSWALLDIWSYDTKSFPRNNKIILWTYGNPYYSEIHSAITSFTK